MCVWESCDCHHYGFDAFFRALSLRFMTFGSLQATSAVMDSRAYLLISTPLNDALLSPKSLIISVAADSQSKAEGQCCRLFLL